jgi:hypothetical protein
MSDTSLNGQKLVGYAVAGGVLLLLADVSPRLAVGSTGLILLYAVLSHGGQLQQLSKWIGTATSSNTQKGTVMPI